MFFELYSKQSLRHELTQNWEIDFKKVGMKFDILYVDTENSEKYLSKYPILDTDIIHTVICR